MRVETVPITINPSQKRTDYIYLETYNSFNEFIDVQKSRPLNIDRHKNLQTMDLIYDSNGEFEWRGGLRNYDQAVDLLTHGYDVSLKKLNAKVQKADKQGTLKKPVFSNDVHGFVPIVPNAIIGLPHSMINSHLVPKKAKVINLLINMGVNSNIDKDDVENYAFDVMARVVQFEKSGFRVRIDALQSINERPRDFEPTKDKHISYMYKLCLKNEYQPLDLKRVLFPLTHVAYHRIMTFDWYQRVPNANHFDCYGTALYTCGYQQAVADVLQKSNQYLITYGMDLDQVFANVK